MISQLLPGTIDNTYRGQKAALWIFGLVVLVTAAQGASSMLNPVVVASQADGIPVASYPPAAAQAVAALFALLGLLHLIISALCILVLVRYRSLVALMTLLLLLEYFGRRLILYTHPIPRVGTVPGPYISLGLLAAMLAAFVLAIWTRSRPAARPPAT